jgi:hypothetical protein
MATFLYTPEPDEQIRMVKPRGDFWTPAELQALVGGSTAVVSTIDGRRMVINDMGKLLELPLNKQATRIYLHGRTDPIVGPAVVADSREELNYGDTGVYGDYGGLGG